MPFTTHGEYFETLSGDVRKRLEQVQKEIVRQVPDAVACVGYNMPAFKTQRLFIYFAAFKNHIGVYPPITSNNALIKATARFRGPKGNLSFPHDQELPLALIGEIAAALAAQYAKA